MHAPTCSFSQYENYYNHKYTPEKDSVTWKLDYDKTSDFDDVSGHWHIEEHPKKKVRGIRMFVVLFP